jgi:hypothetical protein
VRSARCADLAFWSGAVVVASIGMVVPVVRERASAQ